MWFAIPHRLCEISPQEQMTVIDDDLMHDLDAMDNLDIPIIDEDGMDKAYEMEYEVRALWSFYNNDNNKRHLESKRLMQKPLNS